VNLITYGPSMRGIYALSHGDLGRIRKAHAPLKIKIVQKFFSLTTVYKYTSK